MPVTARTPAEDADESAPESGWQDGMPPSPKKPAKQPKLDFVRLKPGVEAFIPDDLNLEKVRRADQRSNGDGALQIVFLSLPLRLSR